MSWGRLSRVTAPSADPVTLTEAKTQARVEDDASDTYIGDLIDRAVSMIDGPKGIGVCMVSQQWKLTLDCFPRDHIRILLGPVLSVDSIAYVDSDGATQTWDAADYRVLNAGDLVTVEPAYGESWPTVRNVSGAVEVTFTAGYLDTSTSPESGAVPADLKGAVLLMVGHWYNNRELTQDDWDTVERIFAKYRVGVVAA